MSDTARCGAAELPPVCRLFGELAARLILINRGQFTTISRGHRVILINRGHTVNYNKQRT